MKDPKQAEELIAALNQTDMSPAAVMKILKERELDHGDEVQVLGLRTAGGKVNTE